MHRATKRTSAADEASGGTESRKTMDHPSGTETVERGSALVLALLVMIIMTLLGLSFLLAGEMESRIARNQRDAEQALYTAEGGARIVKKWFDAPSGSEAYLVPSVAQMDRTLRYVDDDDDGTYEAYASASAPFNVVYRQGTDDPFERPYRGDPASAFLGTEAHPDVRISAAGSSGEQAFLASLSASLYPAFPSAAQRARLTQIDVYAPPILSVGGQSVRYGLATIKVAAAVFEHSGTPQEKQIASRVVKAVLNETPFGGPLGPLQSDVDIDISGDFAAHWGRVTSSRTMGLPSSLDTKVASSVPYPLSNRKRIIARDMDLDGTLATSGAGYPGTNDDEDGDNALDFDEWVASNAVEDPWLGFWAQGDVLSGGKAISPGCASADCQPMPWFTPPNGFGGGSDDHSNIFKNVSQETFPSFDYNLWKGLAQSGSGNVYYYASNGAGSGTYRLNGTGPSITMTNATNGKSGLFFFDTATNSVPVDADANGTYDNLSDEVLLNGGGYQTGGVIYLNANFRTSGNGSAPGKTLIAPGEPYIDANGNGRYDDTEYFVDLDYPNSPGGTYRKNGMRRVVDGFTRQVPADDASSDGKYNAAINVYGVLYTSGTYDAAGNWIYFGAVVTKTGMYANGGSGTPDLYFDERLLTGNWPPPELNLPLTMFTSWQTEM